MTASLGASELGETGDRPDGSREVSESPRGERIHGTPQFSAVALLLLTHLTPTTGYGEIWWQLGLLGSGFGLMLSPITAAVLSATPPARAGLASSTVNTSRQIGSVLGIAVLGAVIEHQEASNLTNHLVHLRLPAKLSETLGAALANAGASAGRVHLFGNLPFPRSVLLYIIGHSFTDALQPAFMISALALLCTATLATAFLGRSRRSPTADDTPITEPTIQPAERYATVSGKQSLTTQR
jgi:hypothetical protein